MLGTKWKDETYGGYDVVVYEQGVEAEEYENNKPRTIYGRVNCKGRWLPQAWTDMGRAFDNARPHPLDLVPVLVAVPAGAAA